MIALASSALGLALSALGTRLDGGKLHLYSGTRPASPEDPITGTLGVELSFGNPAFGEPFADAISAVALPPTAAVASVTVTHYRAVSADGSAVLDGDVGTDLVLNDSSLVLGESVTVPSFVLLGSADGVALGFAWGLITGSLQDQTDLASALNDRIHKPISKTYNELAAMAVAGALVPLQWYYLTDFRCKHTILNTEDVWTDSSEPLFLQADSPHTFSPEGLSAVYSNDVVHYRLTSTDPNTDKGEIYYRADQRYQNNLAWDYRSTKYRRWEDAVGSGIFTKTTDPGNGEAYQDQYAFGYKDPENHRTFYGNEMESLGNVYNNVFYGDFDVFNNKADYQFYDNTFYGQCTNLVTANKIAGCVFRDNIDSCSYFRISNWYFQGTQFKNTMTGQGDDNVIGTEFENNVMANGFSFNVVGEGFLKNHVLDNFENNNIGIECQFNTIGANFQFNTIANNFQSNIIGNDFQNNHINANFTESKFGVTCQDNIFDVAVSRVTVGNYFKTNTMSVMEGADNSFASCVIGDNMENNTIYGRFGDNVVGKNFRDNELTGGWFEYNNIGNSFGNNSISVRFSRNEISDCFGVNADGDAHGNTITNRSFTNIVTGHNFIDNTFSGGMDSCIVGDNFARNNFAGLVGGCTFGRQFSDNTGLGESDDEIDTCTFGDWCTNNTFEGTYWNNSLEGGSYNTFGAGYTDNTMGASFMHNVIGQNCTFNKFGKLTQYNTIGDNFWLNTTDGWMLYTTIGSDCQFNYWWKNLYGRVIADGVQGTVSVGDANQTLSAQSYALGTYNIADVEASKGMAIGHENTVSNRGSIIVGSSITLADIAKLAVNKISSSINDYNNLGGSSRRSFGATYDQMVALVGSYTISFTDPDENGDSFAPCGYRVGDYLVFRDSYNDDNIFPDFHPKIVSINSAQDTITLDQPIPAMPYIFEEYCRFVSIGSPFAVMKYKSDYNDLSIHPEAWIDPYEMTWNAKYPITVTDSVADFELGKDHETVIFAASANAILPSAASFKGKKFIIKASAGVAVSLKIDGDDYLDYSGNSSINIGGLQAVTVQSDGIKGWYVISQVSNTWRD